MFVIFRLFNLCLLLSGDLCQLPVRHVDLHASPVAADDVVASGKRQRRANFFFIVCCGILALLARGASPWRLPLPLVINTAAICHLRPDVVRILLLAPGGRPFPGPLNQLVHRRERNRRGGNVA